MRQLTLSVRFAVCAAIAGAAAIASGQSAPAPQARSCQLVKDANGNLVLDPNCPTTVTGTAAASPSAPAAQRFPYPGQTEAPDASPAATGQNPTPAGPASPPASKRFPYPGEPVNEVPSVPTAAQPGTPVPGQPPLRDAGSSGESSSASSSSSSSSSSENGMGSSGSQAADPDSTDPDDPAADPAKIEAARRARRKKAEPPPPSSSAREQEDVQVAGFYQNDGNFRGAYDRARDAVSLDKDDPAAHLALAESARRLGKLDEAEQEYKQTLALDPVPKVRKAAEKALKEMTDGS